MTDHIVLDDYLAVAAGQYRGDERRKIAALALHGMPFGFTREHLAALRSLAESDLYDRAANDGDGRIDEWCSDKREREKAMLREVAARIEALLPPEAK